MEGNPIGCEAVSLNNDSSNHWLRDMNAIFFGEKSVYKREVVTLFKLSSKSAIITES